MDQYVLMVFSWLITPSNLIFPAMLLLHFPPAVSKLLIDPEPWVEEKNVFILQHIDSILPS